MKKLFVLILGIVCLIGLFSCQPAVSSKKHVSNEISVPSVQTQTVKDTVKQNLVEKVVTAPSSHKISKNVKRWKLWQPEYDCYVEILLIDNHEYIAYWTKHGYGGGLGFTHSASCPTCDSNKK